MAPGLVFCVFVSPCFCCLTCVKSPRTTVPLFFPFTFSYLKVDMYDDELCIHVLMTCPFFSFFFPLCFRIYFDGVNEGTMQIRNSAMTIMSSCQR
ncbi:hypothetical protein BDV34DRAFT_186196 [Aspergillus parasiticus]|uniref:Secreted protein n=1 Tax=Aspergillus parasiticus TaxID=5067 RepID=A0A5N6E0X6_ASPPA|nr:hypothetical protein BDV34DRAFT_186196 [Aspergillus parasiticus]